MPRTRNPMHKWSPKPEGIRKPERQQRQRKPRHRTRLSERQQERIRRGEREGKAVRLGLLTSATLDRSQKQAPLIVQRITPTGKVLYTAHHNPRGKLVKVHYAGNAPEAIAERAEIKTRRESEKGKNTLIKNSAKREAKRMEKERKATGHNVLDAKTKQERRIREQAVGLALKNVGVSELAENHKMTEREFIAEIHNLYSLMKEYDFRWNANKRKSKIPVGDEKTFARDEMKRLLGNKWHAFRRERNRIAQKIRIEIARIEKAREKTD